MRVACSKDRAAIAERVLPFGAARCGRGHDCGPAQTGSVAAAVFCAGVARVAVDRGEGAGAAAAGVRVDQLS